MLISLKKRLSLAAALALAAFSANAITITYTASNLQDTTAGEDLWRYDYGVTGTFSAFEGFNILFDPAFYTLLQDPTPTGDPAWNVSVIQPDSGLGTTGILNALALADTNANPAPFSVTFVWLGSGQPGAQPFERFDDTFNVVETGQTRTDQEQPIPEPATGVLLLSGWLLYGLRRRG